MIEKYSGKKLGIDFEVCYNPEFIALGSVIKHFLNPEPEEGISLVKLHLNHLMSYIMEGKITHTADLATILLTIHSGRLQLKHPKS